MTILCGQPAPVVLVNSHFFNKTTLSSASLPPLLLVCEHAGRVIPPSLGTLGLTPQALESHIAWDIGAQDLAENLSAGLQAPLILQRYSRLIYDCNRPPEAPDAIPTMSEYTAIPGNEGLEDGARAARVEEIYSPFHKAVDGALAELDKAADARWGGQALLITIHSFTPVYKGQARGVMFGVLHQTGDARLAEAILAALPPHGPIMAERNAPYGPKDGVMHTLQRHYDHNNNNKTTFGRLNVMLELRNDLLITPEKVANCCEWLVPLLQKAIMSIDLSKSNKN
jgi:predicted N-formylglutamate amidohydrolase